MQPHKFSVQHIGSVDPMIDKEWPENQKGICSLRSIGNDNTIKYFTILVKHMSLKEFSYTLTHELFHAHETQYTDLRYRHSKTHGYEAYYNCESEIMARTHRQVYGPEMFKYLKDLLYVQRKQGIRRKTLRELLNNEVS
jgi:hypothetical protein